MAAVRRGAAAAAAAAAAARLPVVAGGISMRAVAAAMPAPLMPWQHVACAAAAAAPLPAITLEAAARLAPVAPLWLATVGDEVPGLGLGIGDAEDGEVGEIAAMNRNAREPKKANHGKRPCSNRRRKRKMRARSNDHPGMSIKKKKGMDM